MSKPKAKTSNEVLAHVDGSKPVRIYRNLHQRCYSVKQGGIVRCHADNVVVTNVKFIVSKAGQKRVRDEQKKNVHAFVEGIVVDASETNDLLPFPWEEIYYNPYQCEGFTHLASNKVVSEAEYCDVGGGNFSPEILAFNIGYKNDR